MMLYMIVIEDNKRIEGIADFMPYGSIGVVYTSPLSLAHGLKACAWASPEIEYLGFTEVDPFVLSEMLGIMAQEGLESLLFDPPADVEGKVELAGRAVPVGEYLDAIEGIGPEFEKLGPEAVREFRRPSHLERWPFVRWPDAEAIAADLRARIQELLARDGP
jgi:hypothetical protein